MDTKAGSKSPSDTASALFERDATVQALQWAIRDAKSGLKDVPGLLRGLIKTRAWEERHVHQTQEIVRFPSFAAFLAAPGPEGLHCTLTILKRLCKDHPDVIDLLDQVTVGREGNPTGTNQHTKNGGIVDISTVPRASPTGTSKQRALRVLREERPDLHALVLDKKKTGAAAMREAGFRPPTAQIRTDSVVHIVKVLRTHCSPEVRAEVGRLLVEETQTSRQNVYE